MIASIIAFVVLLALASSFFYLKVKKVRRNILLGRDINRNDNKSERIKTMLKVAFGQSKMGARPIAAIMHLFIYVAFLITQVELLEIIIDGVSGGHRRIWTVLQSSSFSFVYTLTINFIEIISVLAFIATIVFLSRRNLLKIARFQKPELKGWPSKDANLILLMEIVLIVCIMTMNATDLVLQQKGETIKTSQFLISSHLTGLFANLDVSVLHILERIGWWGHVLGIFGFLVVL